MTGWRGDTHEEWLRRDWSAHPWLWRWLILRNRLQMALGWVLDRPYWHQEDSDLVLRGLRSRRLVDEMDDSEEGP